MSEYIGARIQLFSNANIRYVGTLHEINSSDATVALSQVNSYGTEGRCENPEDEVPAPDEVYTFIRFKGSDVKDLTILPSPNENASPQMPNDPAVVGIRSTSLQPDSFPDALPMQPQQQSQVPQHNQRPQGHQPMPMPYFYPQFPAHRMDHPGGPLPPPGPGYPFAPHGAPPGWYPPPGQPFPHQRQFPGHGPPFMPPGPQQQMPGQQHMGPIGQSANKEQRRTPSQQLPGNQGAPPQPKGPTPSKSTTPAQKAPTPPVQSKPDPVTALAPPAPLISQSAAASKPVSSGVKSGSIVPAVPVPGAGAKPSTKPDRNAQTFKSNSPKRNIPQSTQAAATAAIQSATQAATAAVAAAMAKLPPAPGTKQQHQSNGAVDDLARKVESMRVNHNARGSQPGGRGHNPGRGSRGRGSHQPQPGRKFEVPSDDYDFQSANAKFNKQDLVKEAIASGSPVNVPLDDNSHRQGSASSSNASEVAAISNTSYNKAASFFDNISSETKDRDDASMPRPGGREWRGEEQKRNMETFGQGSVDGSYGGYRGRGRGRFRGRGRGGYRGGRGGHRGGHTTQSVQGRTVTATN